MSAADWFLTTAERDNPATLLHRRHGADCAWSVGNRATPLIHGSAYFGELLDAVDRMTRGDLLLFTDWRGDPDELLTDDPASGVAATLCAAAGRGVDVRGLVWRSHLDKLAFSAAENRHLGEQIERAGGECLLDMRVRTGGSHHQKFVVLRHRDHPELDVAYVGGIDLCHGRRDDASHAGDRQRQPMAAVYGSRPPWHDATVALRGPVVGEVETVFRERWDDPNPLTRNPVHLLAARLRGEQRSGRPLPAQLADPAPVGPHAVQLLRTYPDRLGGYPFAPTGERSVAHGYTKALRRARTLVYVEDQYLWSREVAATFAEALRRNPDLRVIAVLPHHPDQDGRFSLPPNLIGRDHALAAMRAAGGDRVAAYGIENAAGTPVYVHAKVCVVDDCWATIGSDNFNRRSWTHDSELSAAVYDEGADTDAGPAGSGPIPCYARDLRVTLLTEHLDGAVPTDVLADPVAAFGAIRSAAATLDAWWRSDRRSPRPPGRLRPIVDRPLPALTRAWASVAYARIYDPDGRPRSLRRRHAF